MAAQDGKGTPIQLTSGSATCHFPPVWSPRFEEAGLVRPQHAPPGRGGGQPEAGRGGPAAPCRRSPSTSSPPTREWLAYTKRTDNGQTAIFLYGLDEEGHHHGHGGRDGSNEPRLRPRRQVPLLPLRARHQPHPGLVRAVVHREPHLATPGPHPPGRPALALRAPERRGQAARSPRRRRRRRGEGGRRRKDRRSGSTSRGSRRRVVPFPVAGRATTPGPAAAQREGLLAVRADARTLTDGDGPQGLARASTTWRSARRRSSADGLQGYDLSPDGAKVLLFDGRPTTTIVEPKEGLKPGDRQAGPLGPAHGARPAGRVGADLPGMRGASSATSSTCPTWGRSTGRPCGSATSRSCPGSATASTSPPLGELVGELGSGHSYVGGGDLPQVEKMPVGVLGADLRLDAKARPSGSTASSRARAGPRTGARRCATPVAVKEGDYLLAIDGKDLGPEDEPYRLLAGKADRAVTLLVSKLPEPDRRPRGHGAHPRRRGHPPVRGLGGAEPQARSTRRRRDASATSTSPTWAATACRSSSASTTRRCARRASSSTCGRTAAASSRR